MTSLQGVYFDGRSARRTRVSVHRKGDALVIGGDNVSLTFPLSELRVEPRVGNTRRAIHLPDGGQVSSDDHQALDALFPRRNLLETWIHALERRWGFALGGILVTVLVAWYAIVHGLPAIAERVARHVPASVEQNIGEQTLAVLDRTLFTPSLVDSARQTALRNRFTAFTGDIHDGHRYQLEFRGGHMGPNAFALPGGTIVMTDAMVKLAENDEQLLAVLAHEIGHVRGRHSVRMALQGVGVAALIAALAGDAVSVTTLAATLPTVLTQSSYSREFETEADTYAFQHLKAHQLSPRYFADIMRLLEKHSGAQVGKDDVDNDYGYNYLSSHPATEARIRRALENQ